MGPVFRGEDGETRDPVVIKVIRVGLPPERVAIVASALAALRDRLPSHPALAPLIDTGVLEVEPYIVSPSIDGDSLDVALREYGPAHMTDALPRLRQLADAMDAAAAVGVSHGSLHLRDIIVSVGETVLTGMGVASVLERVSVRPPVRRPYCAPEVALGHGISPAADQYALAAIAHEWLSGRRLSGTGAAGFQVPALSEAGVGALQGVFARAMDESPDDRFPTATAFVEALAELAGYAAPRSKSSRRVPAVEAPRLAFDEPADMPELAAVGEPAADDEVVPDAGELPVQHAAPDDDPLDAPLHVAVPAALDWDPEPDAAAAPEAFSSVDDEAAADDVDTARPAWSPDPADEPALAVDPPSVQTADEAGGSWVRWAALLALVTAAALAGGWALLRWGTPTPATVTSATTATPDEAGTPAPMPAPATPAPAAASRPPATSPAATSSVSPVRTSPPPAKATTSRPATPMPSPARPSAPAPSARRNLPPPPSSRPAPAAANAGRVLVRSTPSGAEVFVNGERRGVTPLALRDLPFGAYAVRVARAGFTPVEERVAIDAGRPARSLEVALTRTTATTPAVPIAADATAPGSLLVESRPAGALVTVDGAEVGVTPVTVPTLTPGNHTVRIERAGFAPITTTARVEARTRARVAVTLTAERPR